jgi:hypothetical protein
VALAIWGLSVLPLELSSRKEISKLELPELVFEIFIDGKKQRFTLHSLQQTIAAHAAS